MITTVSDTQIKNLEGLIRGLKAQLKIKEADHSADIAFHKDAMEEASLQATCAMESFKFDDAANYMKAAQKAQRMVEFLENRDTHADEIVAKNLEAILTNAWLEVSEEEVESTGNEALDA